MTAPAPVPRIHVVGRKNSGKTTLVCELVRELTDRGLKVATVKHTHHEHELDTPGKDSHQHRISGAAGVGILSKHLSAAFLPVDRDDNESSRYAPFETMFQDCDLILVEGDLNCTAPRIEVWRKSVSEEPYAASMRQIEAVVTDDELDVAQTVFVRANLEPLIAFIIEHSTRIGS